MDVNVNFVLCIHDVKTTTLRCGKPEEEDKGTAGEDDSAGKYSLVKFFVKHCQDCQESGTGCH